MLVTIFDKSDSSLDQFEVSSDAIFNGSLDLDELDLSMCDVELTEDGDYSLIPSVVTVREIPEHDEENVQPWYSQVSPDQYWDRIGFFRRVC